MQRRLSNVSLPASASSPPSSTCVPRPPPQKRPGTGKRKRRRKSEKPDPEFFWPYKVECGECFHAVVKRPQKSVAESARFRCSECGSVLDEAPKRIWVP
jgi:hypothetical protein